MSRIQSEYLFIILAVFYICTFIRFIYHSPYPSSWQSNLNQLKYKVKNLSKHIQDSRYEIALLQKKLDEMAQKKTARMTRTVQFESKTDQISQLYKFQQSPSNDGWPNPIAVLIFVCNRPKAIENHLQKLLRYRPSAEKFPIIVSQDCDDPSVKEVVEKFGDEVHYVKQISGRKAHITVIPEHKQYITYYRIARHYKLGLSYVFDKLNHSTVIITEDDLDIAPDFFEYFSATRPLLSVDKSLYCVSAWNDNGKPSLIDKKQPELLYRSDFFPGLGWMMTKELWNELRPIWPSGFWDDWMRNNTVRKNRACIRPEISRTGMTLEGKKGASRGLFFTQHLAKILVNEVFVNFTKLSLQHLIKNNYDNAFLKRVYSAKIISSVKLLPVTPNNSTVRIQYRSLEEYLLIADYLKIMRDFKDGVPRTAYLGVVTCFINGIRIYIAPNEDQWQGYNSKWEAPSGEYDMPL